MNDAAPQLPLIFSNPNRPFVFAAKHLKLRNRSRLLFPCPDSGGIGGPHV